MPIVYDPRFVESPKEVRRIQDRAVDWWSGLFTSWKPNGRYRTLRFDGILMRNLFAFLENRRDVVTFEAKATPIDYFSDGRWRSIRRSVVVELTDGSRVAHVPMWTRHAKRMNFERRRPSIEAALRDENISELVLTTEQDVLVRPRCDNEMRISSARTFTSDPELQHQLHVAFIAAGERTTVRRLREAVRRKDSYNEIVRFVADGEWALEDIDLPFDDRAVLVRRRDTP